MKVIFSKYAKQELEDGASFYELQYHGLGKKFKEEVRRAILRILIIQRHGQLSVAKLENAFCTSSRIRYFIQ